MALPSLLLLLLLVHRPHLQITPFDWSMTYHHIGGNEIETFQSLIVSSAAALATVLPSGEVANRRTLN